MANISGAARGATRRGGRQALAAALVVAAGCGVLASGAGAAPGPRSSGFGSNWTVYHGNDLSTGLDPAGTVLSPLRSAWRSPALDGSLFGEPLVYGGRVVIATTNDTIYELSAHNGAVLWHRHYATAVPTHDLACSGDVDPTVGITGTPVIDPSRSEIFAVADERSASGSISHHLLGVDLETGRVELNEVAEVPGRPTNAELQRPGLTLDRGQVIIGYGGNDGDCGNYTGAIVAVPERGGPDRVYTVEPTAGDREGAVWQGGGSPLVDSSGNIWFSTGNGSAGAGDPYDFSDSVTELSPTLAREQYFAPSTWASDNANDQDLGSAAPAFVDGYVFQVGKLHVGYLLNPGHLGGIGGAGGGLVDSMPVCNGDPHGGLAVQGDTVYVGCSDGIWAIAVSTSSPHLRVRWTNGTGSNGAPIVAGGLVWSIDGESGSGTLYGMNPSNGHVVVTKSTNGEDTHFPTPTVADGLLLAPAHDRVYAFMGPAGLPRAPSGSGTMTVSPTTVKAASQGTTLTFTYTAASGGTSGGEVETVVPAGWSAPSTTHSAAGYVASTCGTVHVSGSTVAVSGLTLAAGRSCKITYGSKAGHGPGATAPSTAGTDTFKTSEASTSPGSLLALKVSPAVKV